MCLSSRLTQYRLSIDLLDQTMLELIAERCRLVQQSDDCTQLRHEVWLAMGQYSEGMGRGLSQEFLSSLGHILDQAAQLDVPSPIQGMDPNDLLGSREVFDKTLILILSERFKVVQRIGKIKQDLGVVPLDPQRWAALLSEREATGERLGISKPLIRKLFELIHRFALDLESKV